MRQTARNFKSSKTVLIMNIINSTCVVIKDTPFTIFFSSLLFIIFSIYSDRNKMSYVFSVTKIPHEVIFSAGRSK